MGQVPLFMQRRIVKLSRAEGLHAFLNLPSLVFPATPQPAWEMYMTGITKVSLPPVITNKGLRGAGAGRLGRGGGAGGRDLTLAARPRRWQRARRAVPTAASKVWGSSAARAASKPRTAGLHARTRIGSATGRGARHRCLCRTSPRSWTRHRQQGTGGGFCSGRGAWKSSWRFGSCQMITARGSCRYSPRRTG